MLSWATAYLVSEWAIRLAMLVYVPQRRTPAAARTWLLLIFFWPAVGLVVYWLFGRIYYPKRRLEEQVRASQYVRDAQAEMRAKHRIEPPPLDPLAARCADLARRLGDFEAWGGNRVELLPDYQGAIERLVADIDAARDHVHLLYYIFEDDATGRRVADALTRAAGRGVTCRLLADAVGAKHGLARFGPRLRAVGIEVTSLLPVGLFRRGAARFDLRNHRKLAVIDGAVGHIGSQNIVDPEFIPGCPNEELVARVAGPVVAQLQAAILADRYFETGHVADDERHFPHIAAAGEAAAQLLPSGPGYGRENMQTVLVSLIHAARERVVITTPYFVPDEAFLQALATAATRGVETRLIVSARSNQRLTQLAQASYYEQLLVAGVAVHTYEPRFLHAKHMTVDRSIALIGSTNIDIRSFALNCEASLLVYDADVVRRLEVVQARYLAASRTLEPARWLERSLGAKVAQNAARLADSLL
ncbi:MAG TPA: cardiolipin synthase [Burkholderiales bacterium]|nr:cardiolipin synthase [Burkholderiales bacterium]